MVCFHFLERLKFGLVLQSFGFVAFGAKQLQIVLAILPHIEAHAPGPFDSVVLVALWFDAIQLQVLRRAAMFTDCPEIEFNFSALVTRPSALAESHDYFA